MDDGSCGEISHNAKLHGRISDGDLIIKSSFCSQQFDWSWSESDCRFLSWLIRSEGNLQRVHIFNICWGYWQQCRGYTSDWCVSTASHFQLNCRSSFSLLWKRAARFRGQVQHFFLFLPSLTWTCAVIYSNDKPFLPLFFFPEVLVTGC